MKINDTWIWPVIEQLAEAVSPSIMLSSPFQVMSCSFEFRSFISLEKKHKEFSHYSFNMIFQFQFMHPWGPSGRVLQMSLAGWIFLRSDFSRDGWYLSPIPRLAVGRGDLGLKLCSEKCKCPWKIISLTLHIQLSKRDFIWGGVQIWKHEGPGRKIMTKRLKGCSKGPELEEVNSPHCEYLCGWGKCNHVQIPPSST